MNVDSLLPIIDYRGKPSIHVFHRSTSRDPLSRGNEEVMNKLRACCSE